MKSKHKIILGISVLLSLLLYSFLPIITYDTRNSQHVNSGIEEGGAPGRVFLTDRNGVVITDKAYPNGYYKHIDTDINSEFVQAVVAIEDKSFYNHHGVNVGAKLRAIKDNISGERLSGGSTITEQYVKNHYFRGHKRTLLQKLREAMIASVYVENTKTKEQILNLYYHGAYFGNRLYGIGAAMEVYFNKSDLNNLTQEEITLLLTLLHNPGAKSVDETYFQEYFEQAKDRLGYDFERTIYGKLPSKKSIEQFPFVTGKFPHTERSTIDRELQSHTKEVIRQTLNQLKDKNVTNAAVFAMIPSTREVLIYQGSKDFHATDIDGQVDVIQALRQPGSTMKPFLYLLALENGAFPDDLIIDIESEYNSFQENSVYISENYSLKEYGLVRLKKALGNSFNNATVRLAREIGLEKVYGFYKDYGFQLPETAKYYGYSLVLGNPSISLESLVVSYTKLLDLDDPHKYMLYDILSDPDNRDVSFGVNSILSTRVPQAVKTGTSSDFRNNLVVSYHPDLVVGVWVGNNDNSSMEGVTGITGAGYIWQQIIEKATDLGYIRDRTIEVPKGLVEKSYCLDKNCFRLENIIATPEKIYYSAIADNIYATEDIYEELDEYEVEKLNQLGVEIQ